MAELAKRFAFRRGLRASTTLLLALGVGSACTDEVGGDGWVKPTPANSGGNAGSSDGGGEGGDDAPMTGGKGGSSGGKGGSSSGGKGGSGGSGGRAGSGMTDAGAGGEMPSGPVCGNGTQEEGEECDDGNTKSGDGCNSNCNSSCEVCEATYCKAVFTQHVPNLANFYGDCFNMPGTATTGKGQGALRKDLCRSVIDCVRTEDCAQFVPDDAIDGKAIQYQFIRCFCDRDITENGYLNKCKIEPISEDPKLEDNTFMPGACARQFDEASERDTKAEAFNGIATAQLKPLGAANLLLLECDRKLCMEECFPEQSAGQVAQITADISGNPTASGESPMGELIADAQRAALGTDFAFLNVATFQPEYFLQPDLGFFYAATVGRRADADGRLLESEVTSAIFGVEARNNSTNVEGGKELVSLELTGQGVYDFLNSQLGFVDVSGLTYSWDAALDSGSRVTEVRKANTPLDKAATYSVTVNDKLLQEVPGAKNVVKTGKNPVAELLAYLKAQTQPVAPPTSRVTRSN